ncbi:copper amine oxidase N-terminal domain-containing protein [Metallumcola ferriviriculae]|uniref:Copper amine oxidase N-terminal domain-containing protein n=1 Tax=Metallumcola ferriviriculae TaxID=3039180 RepID=A0AAU0UKZ8_9FIRM|nr:copper amine oxidase N-terminal domain-containing protein [Desulfitibacteraceae bacterium MK1]
MRRTRKTFVMLLSLVIVFSASSYAAAEERFASWTGNECSYCHDSSRHLNENGKAYLEAGKPHDYGWKNISTPEPSSEPQPTPIPAPISKPNNIILKIGDPYMKVNGQTTEVDPRRETKPLIVKGRTLLPIRTIVETIGGNIDWDSALQQVLISLDGNTIRLVIGSNEAYKKDTQSQKWVLTKIDVPAQIINERTMVPVRFVTESLGLSIDWDQETKAVTITY